MPETTYPPCPECGHGMRYSHTQRCVGCGHQFDDAIVLPPFFWWVAARWMGIDDETMLRALALTETPTDA